MDVILEKASKTNVLIINEAHNKPQHRIFITHLIQKLSSKNYKYYAPESLINYNKQVFKNKFPKLSSEYTFINEPSYSKAIRMALSCKYKILQYEDVNSQCYTIFKSKNKLVVQNKCNTSFKSLAFDIDSILYDDNDKREFVQALNLFNYIKLDSTSKYLIHCGYTHGSKENKMMGYYLEKLGINFISINQTYFNEQITCSNYLPEYFQNIHDSLPFTLLDSQKMNCQIFSKNIPGNEDVIVYHPQTKLIKGRPNWLYNRYNDGCWPQNYFLNYDNAPFKIMVYRKDEFDLFAFSAIPEDVFEIENKTDIKTAILTKEIPYYIIIRDFKNNLRKIEFINKLKIGE